MDWYLFDVSDDGKTAYFVSTPTYWVPDTSKEVNGAWVPKLVSSWDTNTNAIRQAIQKLANGTNSYSSSSVTYTPSDDTLEYFKSVNSQWSQNRATTLTKDNFKTILNENEQAACYLADADIFAGIKEQVNSAEGNLKGKIKTLVGGASVEQWCTAYNKQTAASSSKITCEYQATDTPGYIFKVNDKVQNSGWYTNEKTILGSDIYGAADTNNHPYNSTYPFYSDWFLASPSSDFSNLVCYVSGFNSKLLNLNSNNYCNSLSLFASVEL